MPGVGRGAFFGVVCALAVAVATPAHAQGPVGGISTPNLEHVSLVPLDGRANGGKLVGKYLYVTTGKTLEILDVSEPLTPVRVGKLDFELLDGGYLATGYQEDVDSDGRFLIRSDGGTMSVVDVRDPAKPAVMGTLDGVDNHTMSCILGCTWVYGSEGDIADVRDPTKPVEAGSWSDALGVSSSHDVTEVSPGIVLTATEPMFLLDARKDPRKPVVLAEIPAVGFVHGAAWPDQMNDDIALAGGEAIGPSPACADDPSSTFQTWDTRNWQQTKTFKLIDEYKLRPLDDGATASVWCTHWFDHHPSFRTGGLVTISWYEQGVRLLSVARDGKISQTGYYLPHGGSVWDQKWITDRILYTFDHHRGIDILRYTGEIPAPAPRPGGSPAPAPGSPGTPGAQPQPAGPPAPAAPARARFGDLATMTSAKRCVTAKTLSVRARRRAGDPVAEIVVRVAGKFAKRVRGAAVAKPVRLAKLPRKRFTLRVDIVTKSGQNATTKRAFTPCGPSRSASKR